MACGPNPGDRSRFAKLGMAINEELTQACRDVLEMEVPPGLVYSKVKKDITVYKKLRPDQELRLTQAKKNGYKEFDITLLYTLIRNVCTKIPRPTKGWGGNTMPSVGETTIGDDVERIRMIRNNMFGHISSASTSQREFDDTWSIITDICQRLQTYTKKDYLSGLSLIQRQALEEENEKAIIEKLDADYKNNTDLKEKMSSLESHLQGIPVVDEILNYWREENTTFVPTKASRIVEEKLKSHNIAIVVGNSGSGKSAIIQHIALMYKDRGTNVVPVDEVREIKEKYSFSTENDTLFVLNDPLGKESLDEILYILWKNYQKTIEICLKKVKLLVSCRRCVLYDKRVKGILFQESTIVEIDNEENRLTYGEKRLILNQYTQNLELSDDIVSEIIKTEAYFPLLCKLFSRSNYKENGLDFFKSPKRFIKEEIEIWKKKDKKKFCALILVVAFKNNLKIETIVRNDDSKKKYKDILGMCELPENTYISVFRSTLQELKGSYVKCVGHVFQFLHDFIMEITTLVFGVDCPQETIQYADSGFLRRRVRIEDDTEDEDRDPFTVYLPEDYIGDLVDRFIIDMQTEHLLDVILNPCLRNESVIKEFKDNVDSSDTLPNIILDLKFSLDKSELKEKQLSDSHVSRIFFLDWRGEVCPLIGFIAFCHDEISLFFMRSLEKKVLQDFYVFSAVCANGGLNLLDSLRQEFKETAINEIWGLFYPIHVASVFHNFELIPELIRLGADVNMLSAGDIWTPLILAAGNDEEHLREAGKETKVGESRNKTISCLLNNGAKINLCGDDGTPPLWIACKKGYTSTVQVLLSNGADINLCDVNRISPLYIACQNRHDSTVQLLLKNGANINLCDEDGESPLWTACQNGHNSTVQLLLNNGANINLCDEGGESPLWTACQYGHNSTVQLLLNNGADINSCVESGVSPLSQASKNGHDSMVQLLLDNGADINSGVESGVSPLSQACKNGQDSTVQLLLNNGANVNLCAEDGASPLWKACQNGHNSTVQLLLDNGAYINLCNRNGVSPLSIACKGRNNLLLSVYWRELEDPVIEKIVNLLLNNGANVNLCDEDGASPLWEASQNGRRSTVQQLLNNGANVNICNKNGASPLYTACENGHDSTVQLLLNNDADINLCNMNGTSPLWIACQNGHDSTVKLLVNSGAKLLIVKGNELNICDENRDSPLHKACRNGHDNIFQLLLNNDANVNLCNMNGFSPLYISCQEGHVRIVELLLLSNAGVNLCDNAGNSPLNRACLNGHEETVKLLLNSRAQSLLNINLCNNNGESPLFKACQNGHESIIQLLINSGADVKLFNKDNKSPLHIACENGHDNTVQMLLKYGAEINLPDKPGESPLFKACRNGHESIVQLFLNIKADVNLCNKSNCSPLNISCQYGHKRIVQLLLNNGARINLCDDDCVSPLYVACRNGHDDVAKLLLNNDADFNLCDKDRVSPLWIACEYFHCNTIEILLNSGADVNLCNKGNCSPLFLACFNGNDSVVNLLLNNGADINLCDNEGTSPLYIACENGHYSTVQLLLNKDACDNLRDQNNKSPIYIACHYGHEGIVDLLLNNGAEFPTDDEFSNSK